MFGKTFILAIASMSLAATPSFGETGAFHEWHSIGSSPLVTIGAVRAPADGVVEIYDFHGGQVGKLLGVSKVRAGANRKIRVNTRLPQRYDVIAFLKVGDTVVSQRRYALRDE